MKRIFLFIICLFTFWAVNSIAITFQVNYKVEAIYVYSFTKYISWPEGVVQNQFVIGVYGFSQMHQELETVTNGKLVEDKSIVVKSFKTKEEIDNCQILFIPSDYMDELPSFIKIANSKHILLVTEEANSGYTVAGINLVKVEGKQKFELNEAMVKKAGLKISNQLIPLAILVK